MNTIKHNNISDIDTEILMTNKTTYREGIDIWERGHADISRRHGIYGNVDTPTYREGIDIWERGHADKTDQETNI